MPGECPDNDALALFLLGSLDEPKAEQIERHFGQCERCGEAAAKLSHTDRLTAAMRATNAISREDEAQLEELSARLMGMGATAEKLKNWQQQSTVLHGLFNPVSTSSEVCLKVYYQQELVFATALNKPLEIGRQEQGTPPPYYRHERDQDDRVVVAPLNQTNISRRHLHLVYQQHGRVKATSLTSKGDIVINSQFRLGPNKSCKIALPTLIQLGDLVIRLEAS